VASFYLDDCANSEVLASLLRQAGHHVSRPTDADVGLTGEDDQVHFAFAAEHGHTLITKNPADFEELHEQNSAHAGIFAIYQDNDPSRDMSNAEIVQAIKNLEEAAACGGPTIQGEFHVLNDWRY
jgi:hypothetical protein